MSNTSTTFWPRRACPGEAGCRCRSRRTTRPWRSTSRRSQCSHRRRSWRPPVPRRRRQHAPDPTAAAAAPAPRLGGAPSAETGALPTPEKTDIKIGLSVTETSQFAAKLAERPASTRRTASPSRPPSSRVTARSCRPSRPASSTSASAGPRRCITSQTTDVPVVGRRGQRRHPDRRARVQADVKTAEDLERQVRRGLAPSAARRTAR